MWIQGAIAERAASLDLSPGIQAENNAFLLNEQPPVAALDDTTVNTLSKSVMESLTEETRLESAYRLGYAHKQATLLRAL